MESKDKLWNKEEYDNSVVYMNNDIDLKLKVFDDGDRKKVYVNYKGYNIAKTMLLWEFKADLEFADIYNVEVCGQEASNMYFSISGIDLDAFIEEVYFFVVDHNTASALFDDEKFTM